MKRKILTWAPILLVLMAICLAIQPVRAAIGDIWSVGPKDEVRVTSSGGLILSKTLSVTGTGVLHETSFSDSNITNVGRISLDSIIADASAIAIGNNTETVAINSSDWDISATGDMTGIGAITSNGIITFAISDVTKFKITAGGNTTVEGQLSCHNGLAIDTGGRNDMYIIQATQAGNGGGLYVNNQGTGNAVLIEDEGVAKFKINNAGNTTVEGQLACHSGLIIDTGARNDIYILSATQEGSGGGLYVNNKGAGDLIRFDDNSAVKFAIDYLGNATFYDDVNITGGYLTLPITDTDGTAEGQIWYDDSENKLKFFNGTAVETVNSST